MVGYWYKVWLGIVMSVVGYCCEGRCAGAGAASTAREGSHQGSQHAQAESEEVDTSSQVETVGFSQGAAEEALDSAAHNRQRRPGGVTRSWQCT